MYSFPQLPFLIVGMVLAFYLPRLDGGYGGYLTTLLVLFSLSWGALGKDVFLKGVWLCLGMLYALYRIDVAMANQVPIQAQKKQTWQIQVVDILSADQENERQRLQVKAWREDANIQTEPADYQKLILNDYQARSWEIGSVWKVQSTLKAPIATVNADGSMLEAWALSQNIQGLGNMSKVREEMIVTLSCLVCDANQYRQRQLSRLQVTSQNTAGVGLMAALGLGYQNQLPPDTWQMFRDLGVMHLVSISGLHIGMVAVLSGLIMRVVLRFTPFKIQYPRLWALYFGIVCASMYAVMAGFSVPTQRSLLMLWVVVIALTFKSKISVYSAWLGALAAVLIWQPSAVLGVGTWLSFGFIFLIVFASHNRTAQEQQNRWLQAIQAQWVATVGSILMLGYLFFALPVLSPFINMIAIPWFSLVLTPLTLVSLLLPFDGLLKVTAWLSEQSLQLLMWLSDYAYVYPVAKMPIWMWPTACFVLVLSLLPYGFGFRMLTGIWLVIIMTYQPKLNLKTGEARMTVFDVGQGSSLLIQTQQYNLLFDTGTPQSSQNLLGLLRSMGVQKLDAVVISHQHADHSGGLALLQKNIDIKSVWLDIQASKSNMPSNACQRQSWVWDEVYFEFLTLPEQVSSKKENNQSCVLRVLAQNQATLMTGDLERSGEEALVAQYQNALYSQTLILGHHGSRTSSTSRFLHQVRPDVAIASSGYLNAYYHPGYSVPKRLEDEGIALYRTDWMGGLSKEMHQNQPPKSLLGYVKYWQQKPITAIK